MIPQRIPPAHKDSFGFLRTSLLGVTTWTDRQLRNTGIVLPHIAKGDVFSYNVQLNHDKKLASNLDDFHLHIIPIGAPGVNEKVAIDYSWGFYKTGDVIPDVLPNNSITPAIYQFLGTEQYKTLKFHIVYDLDVPMNETYSSFLLIKCIRRNDAQDTYAGEIALLGADAHYVTNRNGSLNETTD